MGLRRVCIKALTYYWLLPCISWGCPGGSAGEGSARNVGDLGSIPGLERSPGEGNGIPLQYSCLENSMDYIGSDGKASAYNEGDPGSIPGSGISPGEGNGNPLQHSCLENPTDGGA